MKTGTGILIIGILLIASGFADLYIILDRPEYALPFFGQSLHGVSGWIVKLQSPILHAVIGYGFLRLKKWSFWLYMAYALFGMTNALTNLHLLGPGLIRYIFIASLFILTLYIYFQRKEFHAGSVS